MVKLGGLRRHGDSFSVAVNILPGILGKEDGCAVAVKAVVVVLKQLIGKGPVKQLTNNLTPFPT